MTPVTAAIATSRLVRCARISSAAAVLRHTRAAAQIAALLMLLAPPLAAQTRADLRYAVDAPFRLSYAAMEVTRTQALTDTGSVRTVEQRTIYDVEFDKLDEDIVVRVAVRERASSAGSSAALPDAVEQTISARGPRPDPTDERSLEAMMTVGPLLYLPGRDVALRESWTDTVGFVIQRDTVLTKVRSIITGTYDRDSIVNGRRLNVVRFHWADIMATETPVAADMTLIGSTSGGRREVVLWDPRRHVLVSRECERETSLEMETLTGPRTTIQRSHIVVKLIE